MHGVHTSTRKYPTYNIRCNNDVAIKLVWQQKTPPATPASQLLKSTYTHTHQQITATSISQFVVVVETPFLCLCFVCLLIHLLLSLVYQVTNVCCRRSLPLICWHFCCRFWLLCVRCLSLEAATTSGALSKPAKVRHPPPAHPHPRSLQLQQKFLDKCKCHLLFPAFIVNAANDIAIAVATPTADVVVVVIISILPAYRLEFLTDCFDAVNGLSSTF